MGLPVDVAAIEEPGPAVRARVAGFGGALHVLRRNRDPLGYVFALRDIVRAGGYRTVWCHGNSATLAFNGEVYNDKPQAERSVTDIIYFASATAGE